MLDHRTESGGMLVPDCSRCSRFSLLDGWPARSRPDRFSGVQLSLVDVVLAGLPCIPLALSSTVCYTMLALPRLFNANIRRGAQGIYACDNHPTTEVQRLTLS